jgi:hypothetical protein
MRHEDPIFLQWRDGITTVADSCRSAPFSAIVWQKCATEAAMFWQLPRLRNVMREAKMPRAFVLGAGCGRLAPIVR